MKWAIATLLLVTNVDASAFGFGDMEDLVGKTVVAGGRTESVECPPNGKYNCSTWPYNLLKIARKNVCFTADRARCSFSCKGFLAMGDDKQIFFFQTESIGDDLSSSPVQLIQCPDIY
ncbi:hypothetical protein [Pseudomonas helleri]|uniref:hypothetical protein n=1 Tax=Pseudomonas helleri TaxID=1608996 RepID=UPI003FCEEFA3